MQTSPSPPGSLWKSSMAASLQRGSPARPAGGKAAEAADLTRESSITFTCAWCKKGKEGGKGSPPESKKKVSKYSTIKKEESQPPV